MRYLHYLSSPLRTIQRRASLPPKVSEASYADIAYMLATEGSIKFDQEVAEAGVLATRAQVRL